MNRIRNRLTAWILAASMIFASAPASAHAEVLHKFESLTRPSATAGQWINPLYEGVLSAPKQNVQLREEAPVVTIDDVRLTLADAADELRQGMVERMDRIAITFSVNSEFDATDIWNEALKHTGNPREGDYLLGQLSSYGFSAYYNELGDDGYFTYVFKPGYFTTAQQEQQMDSAIDALLLELNLDEANEFEKIKGIYDWICANVTYDYDNLNNKDYYLKHSAYAAMIHGTAVCQGFAVLFYRLALELGVDCRYITGTGNGGPHAWNIVRLGSLYYNVDATWDQPLFAYEMPYEYFLRCGANFPDHARDDEYASGDFYQRYPMSPEDYGTDITWPVSGTCGDGLTWVLDAQGTLTVSGSGSMQDFYAEDPQWQQYAYHIRKVVVGPDVKSVGAFAFYYCASLAQVEIQGSAVVCESAFSYCSALEQISMPYVLAIGDAAFYGCSALRAVQLPASLQSLGNEVFYDCILMQTISVDASNPYYSSQDNVLFNKDMTHLYFAASMMGQVYSIPQGVTHIAAYAFRCNAQLQIITIPNSVTSLPEGVFYGCSALKAVSFAGNLQQIGPFAFYGCTGLEQMQLPSGLTQIGDYAFGDTGFSEITIPASVCVIGDGAFDHSMVTDITFTGPAPQIGDYAFGNVFADVYYPSPDCDPSWEDMTWDYGGFLQWYPTEHHSYHPVITHPGCDTPGFTTYTCGCGDSYEADPTDPVGHSWDEGTVTQEPTDSSAGQKTYTCIACGATQTEQIPPTTHEHHYTDTVTPPSCTTDGYTTHTCTDCGSSYTSSVVPASGHSMGQWVQTKAPGCMNTGEESSRCGTCGHEEKRTIAALQHSFTNYVSDGNAACGTDGTKTAACDHGCGEKNTVTDEGSAKSHTMGDWHQTLAPACGTAGEESRTCSSCGFVDRRPVEALQHSFTNYVSDGNAACGTDGTKTATCDHGCGAKDTVADTGSALEHTFTTDVTGPTCTQDGYTKYTCSACGHSYTDDTVAATGHSMGQWERTKEPACEVPGEDKRACSACDHVEYRSVDALVHSFTDYVSDNNASCSADGTKTAVCDLGCGKKDTVADPGTVKPHEMGPWQTVTEPTEESEGLQRRACLHCDHVQEQSIPMIGVVQDITSDIYSISDQIIGSVAVGTTVSQFLSGIHEAEYIKILRDGQEVAPDSLIATGMQVQLIVRDQLVKELTVVVTGDINGDGDIGLSDMLIVKSYVLGKTDLTGAAAQAADTNNDQDISVTDFLQIKAHILGKSHIKPHG